MHLIDKKMVLFIKDAIRENPSKIGFSNSAQSNSTKYRGIISICMQMNESLGLYS